jgi:hypothetical protein
MSVGPPVYFCPRPWGRFGTSLVEGCTPADPHETGLDEHGRPVGRHRVSINPQREQVAEQHWTREPIADALRAVRLQFLEGLLRSARSNDQRPLSKTPQSIVRT